MGKKDRLQRILVFGASGHIGGPLAEKHLRATLRAYFACQESKAAASTKLRVHQKTVAYRLRRAAELLGGPVEDRKTELDAALLVLDTLR